MWFFGILRKLFTERKAAGYSKIEMQKNVELKIKECEIEEMQKKKFYEQAKAEATALGKIEKSTKRKGLFLKS